MHVDELWDPLLTQESRKEAQKKSILCKKKAYKLLLVHLPRGLIYSYLLRTQKPFSLLTSRISKFITKDLYMENVVNGDNSLLQKVNWTH